VTTTTSTTTIGVAIAVPDPWGAQLQAYRTGLGDSRAGGIPTHITLLPPQLVDVADQPAIEQHLTEASAGNAPFRLVLRGTGTFRPVSPVVFVAVAEGISSCEALASAVVRPPLHVDREFPYHPHVTVAHHLPGEQLEQAFHDLEDFDAAFDVHEMWMYLHDDASGWQPTQSFPLGR